MRFGLAEPSPAWLGEDSTCDVLTCSTGDATNANWSRAATGQGGMAWGCVRFLPAGLRPSCTFGMALGGSLRCNPRGGCSGGSPAGMAALRLCGQRRRKASCHQHSDTGLQIAPAMVVLPAPLWKREWKELHVAMTPGVGTGSRRGARASFCSLAATTRLSTELNGVLTSRNKTPLVIAASHRGTIGGLISFSVCITSSSFLRCTH